MLDGFEQVYEYHAGVLTLTRERNGLHSLAIIQCGGNKGSYYKFADNLIERFQLNDRLEYHPRLLFYCKSHE